MVFHIFTIFPEAFESYFNTSILKRAQKKRLVKIKTYDVREFAKDRHRTTDDKPYGGGAGMVMKAEPIIAAINAKIKNKKAKIILLSAKGKQFTQETARVYSKKYKDLVLICGRYEGVDERVKKVLKAEEISIGPFVLTDGEVAAAAVVSGVARLIPGVIKFESLREESHFRSLGDLEYPHYTRPEVFEFKGEKYCVPKVLLSGDHKKISEWRNKKAKI